MTPSTTTDESGIVHAVGEKIPAEFLALASGKTVSALDVEYGEVFIEFESNDAMEISLKPGIHSNDSPYFDCWYYPHFNIRAVMDLLDPAST